MSVVSCEERAVCDATGQRPKPRIPEGAFIRARCWRCGKVYGEYLPPVRIWVQRCERCGEMNMVATEDAA